MPIDFGGRKVYKTIEACERIGRCKNAVLQWIAKKEIEDVERDERGNRIWTDEDIGKFRKHRDHIKERVKESRLRRKMEVST